MTSISEKLHRELEQISEGELLCMDGKCPKCSRVYGAGEASLSADLKAECPQCSVELESYESSEGAPRDECLAQEVDSGEWALATARWAAGGFKTGEMPDFIKNEYDQEPTVCDQEDESQKGQQPESVESQDTMVVCATSSDRSTSSGESQGILTEETSSDSVEIGADELNQKKPEPIKLDLKPKDQLRRGDFKRDVQRSSRARKAKSKRGLVTCLFVILLVLTGLFWYMKDDGRIADEIFSVQGLQVNLVEAPPLSECTANEEALLHYGRGNQYAYQRKWKKAILEFKKALRLDPGYPHPHRALGAVYAAMGKAKQSTGEYEVYLKMAPRSKDAKQVRSIIKTQVGM